MLFQKKRAPAPLYDPETEEPVLRCSICTGEQVAGFRNRKTRQFRESVVIRTPRELQEFQDQCGIKELEKIY